MEIQQTAITAEVLARIAPDYVPAAVRKDHAKGVASPARMSLDTFKELHTLTLEGGSMAKLLSQLGKPITSEQLVEIKRLLKYAPYEYEAGIGYKVKSAKPEFKKPSFQERRARPNDQHPRTEKFGQEKRKPEAKPVLNAATNGLRPIKSPTHGVISLLTNRVHYKLAELRRNECQAPETMSLGTFMALYQLPKGKLSETLYNETNGCPVTLREEVDRLMAVSPWAVHLKLGAILKTDMPEEPVIAETTEVVEMAEEATAEA